MNTSETYNTFSENKYPQREDNTVFYVIRYTFLYFSTNLRVFVDKVRITGRGCGYLGVQVNELEVRLFYLGLWWTMEVGL